MQPKNLIYKTGNILEDDADWIVNPVNCVGVMGKGLALDFKKKYPEYFLHYRELCKDHYISPGAVTFHSKGHWGTTKPMAWDIERNIISFPTKDHFSQKKSRIEDIENGLSDILYEVHYALNDPEYADTGSFESIAFPKLGCGLGGLNWETQVKHLIESFAYNLPESIEVRVYV